MKKFIKWFRIHVLRRVSVVDILQRADEHRADGLCFSIDWACYHYDVRTTDFREACTKFNNEEALKFGAREKVVWWWPMGRWDTGREEFLHYLIKYYSSIKPIYLKRV